LEHYRRPAEFGFLMDRWCEAIQRDITFRQQLDPLTGEFTREGPPNYSPTALLMLDYTWRLAGVREEGDSLEWNLRFGHPAARSAFFRMRTDANRAAEIRYDRRGAELRLAGKLLGRVDSGVARLVTDSRGLPRELVGISEQPQKVAIRLADRPQREVELQPNARIAL
jgi:hypothetical protein